MIQVKPETLQANLLWPVLFVAIASGPMPTVLLALLVQSQVIVSMSR